MKGALATCAVAVAAVVLSGAGGGAAASSTAAPRPNRVLLFSLPHVSWEDLGRYDLPNLNRFLDGASVAALTTRSDARKTRLADGYLTLGAGTRAVGSPAVDGDNLQVGEKFGDDRAGEVFTQRTNRSATRGIVCLGSPRLIEVNDNLLYDADIGAFPDALRDAGLQRSVIGNGDGSQPDTPPTSSISPRRRQLALGLMGSDGTVPSGRIDESLLTPDPAAPFGVVLDQHAVFDAFERAWEPRSVVLVEASDLVREDAYRVWSTSVHREVMLRKALHRSDKLFGQLLEHVDLSRDAVVVFGPAHSSRAVTLTVLGVDAPGFEPGLLRSATTRRSGFVQLIDLAPTVLDLLGIDRPTSMEGRSVEVGTTGGSAAERRDLLIREDAAGQFRDERVGEVHTAAVIFATALAAGLIFAMRRPRPPWVTVLLGRASLCVLAFVPATFLARLVPLHDVGFLGYWGYLVAVSIVLGTLYRSAGRTNPLDAVIVALLANVAILGFDVVAGSYLQFNSALGYSPTAAGRFTGFSNPAYATFAASAVIAAPLLAHRVGGSRGTRLAIALLAAAIIVDGIPVWGSDVGGILSMVPAFCVTAFLLIGWRVRTRAVAAPIGSLVVVLGAFTALDLMRAPERRTHLGRLVERIDDRGVGDFVVVLQRKLAENAGSLTHSIWGLMLPVALVLGIWLARRGAERIRDLLHSVPEIRAAATGFAVLASLGWALNDSGIARPGLMLVIVVAVLTWLILLVAPGSPEHEPARPVAGSAVS